MIHLVIFSIRQAMEGLWRNRVMSLAATVTMVMMLLLVVLLWLFPDLALWLPRVSFG